MGEVVPFPGQHTHKRRRLYLPMDDLVEDFFEQRGMLMAHLHGKIWRVEPFLQGLTAQDIIPPMNINGVILPPLFRADLVRTCRIRERTQEGSAPAFLHRNGLIPSLDGNIQLPWHNPTLSN